MSRDSISLLFTCLRSIDGGGVCFFFFCFVFFFLFGCGWLEERGSGRGVSRRVAAAANWEGWEELWTIVGFFANRFADTNRE